MLLHFMYIQSGSLSGIDFIISFVVLTGTCTFAFLSPETSDKFVNNFKKKLGNLIIDHPKLSKYILIILPVIIVIILAYQTYRFYF